MVYSDPTHRGSVVSSTPHQPAESARNDVLASEVKPDAPKLPPPPSDRTPPSQPRSLRERALDGGVSVTRSSTPLPSSTREELAKGIRSGDKPIVHEGRELRPSDLDKYHQSIAKTVSDFSTVRPNLPDMALVANESLSTATHFGSGYRDVHLNLMETYALSIGPARPDLAKVIHVSVEEQRLSGKPEWQNPIRRSMVTVYDRKSFDEECRHLTIGKNDDGRVLSKREELARGWAIFENARDSRPQFGGAGFIALGRLRETANTGSASLGYTSEYDNGAVFKPEDWSIFINNCWVMGGIKGGASFACISELKHASRASPSSEPEDFRSDGFEDDKVNPPLHFINVVTAGEITALKDFGYKPVEHPDFGVMLVPDPSEKGQYLRSTVTFTELQVVLDNLAVRQSFENLTGEDKIADELLSFVWQGPGRPNDEVMTKLRELIRNIHASGVSLKDPQNQTARNEVKIANALSRLTPEAGLPPETGSRRTLSAADVRNEAAWFEIRNRVLAIADRVTIDQGGGSRTPSDVRLAIVMTVESQRRENSFTLTSGRSVGQLLQSLTVEPSSGRKGDVTEAAARLQALLENYEPIFEKQALRLRDPDELPELWEQFGLAMASADVKHVRQDGRHLRTSDLDGHAASFLRRFDYVPSAVSIYMPDPADAREGMQGAPRQQTRPPPTDPDDGRWKSKL